MLLPMPLALPFLFGPCIPAALAGLLGAVAVILWCIPVALIRRRWRRALSLLALPLLVLLTAPSADLAQRSRDDIWFYLHKKHYEAEAAQAKAEGKHSAVLDDWSIFVSANSFVVWDERDRPEEVMMGFKPYHHFADHFYLVGD
jgi:hypothetical protein